MKSSDGLFLEERRQNILARIEQQRRVSVAELSRQLGVSEVTIRTDLQALADEQLIVRTHGGAIAVREGKPDLALIRRRQQQVQQKNKIGQAAAAMVSDEEAIFLDSSSTTLALTRHLKQRRRLTLITNSLVVAQEMLDASGVTVVMPGGTLQREMASLIDVNGLELLQRFHIQKGFFGAHGISLQEGLTDVSAGEAEFKRLLIQRCYQVVALLDATKWGKVGLASFASLDDVDAIITDSGAPPELLRQVESMDIETIIV